MNDETLNLLQDDSKTTESEGPKLKRTMTTGEVAELMDVSVRTVVNWCETGALVNHSLPNRVRYQHRRVLLADLIEFCKSNNLPHDHLKETE